MSKEVHQLDLEIGLQKAQMAIIDIQLALLAESEIDDRHPHVDKYKIILVQIEKLLEESKILHLTA